MYRDRDRGPTKVRLSPVWASILIVGTLGCSSSSTPPGTYDKGTFDLPWIDRGMPADLGIPDQVKEDTVTLLPDGYAPPDGESDASLDPDAYLSPDGLVPEDGYVPPDAESPPDVAVPDTLPPDAALVCADGDGDGYGQGAGCLGVDCDDTSAACTTSCVDGDLDNVWDCKDFDPADPIVNLNRAKNKPVVIHTGDVCYPDPSDPNCKDWDEIVDGDWNTSWRVQTNLSGTARTVAVIDLQEHHAIKTFRYQVYWDTRTQYGTGAIIELSVSNETDCANVSNWRLVDSRTVSRGDLVKVDLAQPEVGRCVQFKWAGSVGASWNGWGRVQELEVYGSVDRAYGKPLLEHTGDVCYPDSSNPNCTDWDEIVDGDWNTSWRVATNPSTKAVVDLQAEHHLRSFVYEVKWDERTQYGTGAIIRLSVSADNTTWTQIDQRTVGRYEVVQVNVAPPSPARYVRFHWYDAAGASWNGWGVIFELIVVSTN